MTATINTGQNNNVTVWLGVFISLVHITLNYFAILPENWSSAIHFGLFASLAAWVSMNGMAAKLGLSLAAVSGAAYLMLAEDLLYQRGQDFIQADYLFSALSILTAIFLTGRMIGWFIPALVVFFLSYVSVWGQYVPGVFHFSGLSWETLLFRSYFSPDGMFGPIAQLSWTFVFLFVLFGAFLRASGAAVYLLQVASRVSARLNGGSGIMAVVGSALMGSVSGSAIANTAATGVITIPSMKKAGYDPAFAAGVEAAASTGGQLMPPVMGAGAFVMASYTQLPYATIIGAALLPALLFYFSLAFFVRAYSIKHQVDLARDRRSAINTGQAGREKNGWRHLAAIGVLVGCLMWGFTPGLSVGFAIISIIALSRLSARPMGLGAIITALSEGASNMLVTALLLITIGLLVNVINTTGAGNIFSLMVIEWSAGSLLILLLLTALASLILGAGLPVTASYIVVATLLAPVLSDMISVSIVAEALLENDMAKGILGSLAPDYMRGSQDARQALLLLPQESRNMIYTMTVAPEALIGSLLAAHMIIFWLSQDSNITPPVCLVAYTAAGIAGAAHVETSFKAWKLAKAIYLVPLLIAYTPLVMGANDERLVTFCACLAGLFFLVSAWEGVVIEKIGRLCRLVFLILSIALLYPGLANNLKLLVFLFGMSVTGYLCLKHRINISHAAQATEIRKTDHPSDH